MNYIDALSEGFNNHVSVREKRPGITKLIVPLFHEDGDMVDIFLQELPDGKIRVSDYGLSLMRLSYSYDIDTENKNRIFRKILTENHIEEDRGSLIVDVSPDHLYPAVLHFGQTIAKVSNMALYRREIIANLFYENLTDDVTELLGDFKPVADFSPLPGREELKVDFALEGPAKHSPIFLFGVKEREISKLRLAAVSCLEFQKAAISFKSVVVHQDFDSLTTTDRQVITNAVDKQFTSLDEFKSSGRQSIERLAA